MKLNHAQVIGEGFHGEFHYFDQASDSYNPSFSLMIYPRETRTIAEKVQMLQEYGYNVGEQVKSLLFTDGVDNYMITVSGEEKADIEKVKYMLNLGRNENDKGNDKAHVSLYRGDVELVTGRPSGALSPLIYNGVEEGQRLTTIYIARNLLKGYSRPQYHIVLDKRSALVLSDMNDLLEILGGIPSFPIVIPFHNDNSLMS